MLQCTRLSRSLKKKIEQAGEGTQIVGVTWNELHKLNDETGQAAVYAPSVHKKRLMAVHAQGGQVLRGGTRRGLRNGSPKLASDGPRSPISSTSSRSRCWTSNRRSGGGFRFRIARWPISIEYIQAAFGWWNYHLHQFEIDGVQYSQPAPDGDDFDLEFEDETQVVLSNLLPKSAKRTRWIYEYDFGDGWRHEVLFEGFPPSDPKAKYPLCVEGERACPPEDCGGPWGYADYLAAIADPNTNSTRKCWNGGDRSIPKPSMRRKRRRR